MIYVHIGVVALLLVAAIYVLFSENNFYNVVALEVMGVLATLEFLLLHAPDVAIAEAAVGAVLSPFVFLVALHLTKRGEER